MKRALIPLVRMFKTGVNANHVTLAGCILLVFFGAWRLMAFDFERRNLVVFGIGVVIGAWTLSKMGKERQEGRGKPDKDNDHAG